ncbi:hypothetical protein J7L48_08405 [bacterium]|nr:hypothetical protein [bacterium]
MIFKKNKGEAFSQEEIDELIKQFKYKEAYKLLLDSKDTLKTNDPIFYFYFIGLKYLVEKKFWNEKDELPAAEYLKKYQFSGQNELTLGIYIYLNNKDEKYIMDILDNFEIFGLYDDILKLLDEKFKTSQAPEILNKYGFTYWQKKEYKFALQSFKKSLVMNDDPIVFNSMALLYNDLGDQTLAEKYFKEGLKLFPDNFTLLSNYAVLLFNLGLFDKSNKVVKKIKEKGLGMSFLHSGLGKILTPEYEIDLENELKREPKNNSLVLEIGKYLLRRGELEKLVTFLNDEMKKGNESPKIYSLLAYAHYYKYDFKSADIAVSKGLTKFKDNITLLITLVSLNIHRGNLRTIPDTLKKIKEVDPMYIEALFNVAMLLEGSDMFRKAKMFYEWYLEVSDSESTKQVAQWHLDVIYSKLQITKKEDKDEKYF